MLTDLEQQLPPSMKPMLAGVPEYMPPGTGRWAPWMGAAILSKVVFTHNQHVTKVEYQENGPLVTAKLRG
jgi:actin-related protein 7